MNDLEPAGTGNNRRAILAAEICEAHSSCLWHATTSAEQAIEAGNRLIEAKALVKHGEWLPWLDANCRISDRTASRYMRIARSGMKSDTVADLGIRAAGEALDRASGSYEQHPISTIYPPMTADEFAWLCKSIGSHGLINSITLYEGQVLDGWHRELACRKTGATPRYKEFGGDWDAAVRFTLSMNVYRQHLTEDQRAMIALSLSERRATPSDAPGGDA